MSGIHDLYQALVLDHSSRPRNFGCLDDASHTAAGYNPLCGDRLSVYLDVEDEVVRDVRFEGSGCAIAMASASLMTTAIKGKTSDEVRDLCGRFERLAAGRSWGREDEGALGKLSVFARVSEFPGRVKCATLIWHTVVGALDRAAGPVSTE